MSFETRNDVTEEEYIEMIRLKTSVLLACALKMGAILADAPQEDAELLYRLGEQVGLAFQLQDDLLDVYGDPKVFGKAIGGDITSNKKTYMLINAYNRANDEQRKTVLKFGCPDKCKLSIFSVDAAVDKFGRKIDEGIRVMILCNSPVPLLEMYEKGYRFDEITVGNMASKPDAKQIRKTLFVTDKEKDAFCKLADHGVKIISQMIPSEQREDIIEDIRKA